MLVVVWYGYNAVGDIKFMPGCISAICFGYNQRYVVKLCAALHFACIRSACSRTLFQSIEVALGVRAGKYTKSVVCVMIIEGTVTGHERNTILPI